MGKEDKDSERVNAVPSVVGKGAENEEDEVNNYLYTVPHY